MAGGLRVKQDQHIQDHMDAQELRLHEANVELAMSDVRRLGGRLEVMFEIDRPARLEMVRPGELREVQREPIRAMRVMFGDVPLREAQKDVADHFLIAQFKLIAYERWFASNTALKRTTSAFVRDRRPPGPDDAVPDHVIERLNSPDLVVASTAWGALARGDLR